MDKRVLEPTPTAQWQRLVGDAQQVCTTRLGEELESYLVFLLMRFTDQPQMAASVVALEFLQSQQCNGGARHQQLRDVGDKCLLFSGLFPGIAEKRRVEISYFIDLGQSAYGVLADEGRDANMMLFSQLSEGFVPLRDVLQAMRELDGQDSLTPLQAFDMYQQAGSDRAQAYLRSITDGTLIAGGGGVN